MKRMGVAEREDPPLTSLLSLFPPSQAMAKYQDIDKLYDELDR